MNDDKHQIAAEVAWTPWHEAQGSYIPQGVCDKHNTQVKSAIEEAYRQGRIAADACIVAGASSRVCERGTKSCEVQHAPEPAAATDLTGKRVRFNHPEHRYDGWEGVVLSGHLKCCFIRFDTPQARDFGPCGTNENDTVTLLPDAATVTGEWTPEMVQELVNQWPPIREPEKIADAHNAALRAQEEDYELRLEQEKNQAMSEWNNLKGHCDILEAQQQDTERLDFVLLKLSRDEVAYAYATPIFGRPPIFDRKAIDAAMSRGEGWKE